MKPRDPIIAVGFVAAAVAGSASAAFLGFAGRLDATDWTATPAVSHALLLTAGGVSAVITWGLAASALIALSFKLAPRSVLTAGGAIVLSLAFVGGLARSAFDLALVVETRGDDAILDGILFVQRWHWEYDLALLLLLAGALIGLIASGIAFARGGGPLRLPGLALVIAGVVLVIFPGLGAMLIGVVFVWLAISLARASPTRWTGARVVRA